MSLEMKPIGIIHTPHVRREGTPIQPAAAEGIVGTIDLDEAYGEGLQDLDGFSHIILVYYLHRSEGFTLKVVPYLDDRPRGLFATRAPKRPNPIGLSVVRLDRIEGATLYIRNVDMLDGTPLLDIKPYVPEFDRPEDIRTGWLEKVRRRVADSKDDGRFT